MKQRVAETALAEKIAKLTPPSRAVAPNGVGEPLYTSNRSDFGFSFTVTAVSTSAPPPLSLLAFTIFNRGGPGPLLFWFRRVEVVVLNANRREVSRGLLRSLGVHDSKREANWAVSSIWFEAQWKREWEWDGARGIGISHLISSRWSSFWVRELLIFYYYMYTSFSLALSSKIDGTTGGSWFFLYIGLISAKARFEWESYWYLIIIYIYISLSPWRFLPKLMGPLVVLDLLYFLFVDW